MEPSIIDSCRRHTKIEIVNPNGLSTIFYNALYIGERTVQAAMDTLVFSTALIFIYRHARQYTWGGTLSLNCF